MVTSHHLHELHLKYCEFITKHKIMYQINMPTNNMPQINMCCSVDPHHWQKGNDSELHLWLPAAPSA